MTTDRELFWEDLPNDDPRWIEFERTYLERDRHCPLTTHLIACVQGKTTAQQTEQIEQHAAQCPGCARRLQAIRKARQASPPWEIPRSGSLLEVLCGSPSTAPAVEPIADPQSAASSIVLTNFASLVLAGRTSEALEVLRPVLPDLLAALQISPSHLEPIQQYLSARLRQSPSEGVSPLRLLQDYGTEHLQRSLVLPRGEQWTPILVRGALRSTQARNPSADLRELLQAAIDRQLPSPDSLSLILEEEEAYSSRVSPRDVRLLIRETNRHLRRLTQLVNAA